jgi:hypothetical protein
MAEVQYWPNKIEKEALVELFYQKCNENGKMQLINFLIFAFDKNLISNENGLELFYTVFHEVAINYDLL